MGRPNLGTCVLDGLSGAAAHARESTLMVKPIQDKVYREVWREVEREVRWGVERGVEREVRRQLRDG